MGGNDGGGDAVVVVMTMVDGDGVVVVVVAMVMVMRYLDAGLERIASVGACVCSKESRFNVRSLTANFHSFGA